MRGQWRELAPPECPVAHVTLEKRAHILAGPVDSWVLSLAFRRKMGAGNDHLEVPAVVY